MRLSGPAPQNSTCVALNSGDSDLSRAHCRQKAILDSAEGHLCSDRNPTRDALSVRSSSHPAGRRTTRALAIVGLPRRASAKMPFGLLIPRHHIYRRVRVGAEQEL